MTRPDGGRDETEQGKRGRNAPEEEHDVRVGQGEEEQGNSQILETVTRISRAPPQGVLHDSIDSDPYDEEQEEGIDQHDCDGDRRKAQHEEASDRHRDECRRYRDEDRERLPLQVHEIGAASCILNRAVHPAHLTTSRTPRDSISLTKSRSFETWIGVSIFPRRQTSATEAASWDANGTCQRKRPSASVNSITCAVVRSRTVLTNTIRRTTSARSSASRTTFRFGRSRTKILLATLQASRAAAFASPSKSRTISTRALTGRYSTRSVPSLTCFSSRPRASSSESFRIAVATWIPRFLATSLAVDQPVPWSSRRRSTEYSRASAVITSRASSRFAVRMKSCLFCNLPVQ